MYRSRRRLLRPTISGRYHIGEVLYRLIDQVVGIFDIHGAGMSLADDGALRFVTATDEAVTRVDEREARPRMPRERAS